MVEQLTFAMVSKTSSGTPMHWLKSGKNIWPSGDSEQAEAILLYLQVLTAYLSSRGI